MSSSSQPEDAGGTPPSEHGTDGSDPGTGVEGVERIQDSDTSGPASSSPEVFQKNKAIWKLFTVGDKPTPKKGRPRRDRKAVCNTCQEKIARSQGSTSGMRNHLKRKHPELLTQLVRDEVTLLKKIDGAQSDLEDAFQEREEYSAKRKGNYLNRK